MGTHATAAEPGVRHRFSFGGLVPTGAHARAGSTSVAVLSVEVHQDGAVLPLMVLSDNAGPIALDAEQGVVVVDDTGRDYRVEERAQHPGLGLLQLDLWISPAPPPEARRLSVSVDGLTRTAITRRGDAVSRLLSDGPWQLDIDLVPARTSADIPEEPPRHDAPPPPARVPVRAFEAFEGLLPVGQARVGETSCVCVWAIERYRDRAVVSLSVLSAPEARPGRAEDASSREVELWDDRGRRYEVAPVHSVVRPGWSELTLEVTPALAQDIGALGVRVSAVQDGPGEEPAEFGVLVGEG